MNVYHVELSNGESFTVTTIEHHDDHQESGFKKHLADVITRTGAMVGAQMIMRFMFKGRKV